jgi:LDH2 family malate/lactate/ureidoglycolate dehydrogenase
VIPGDPERRRRAHVAEHGINLDETIRDQLVLISDELGVAVPSAAL